MDKRDRKEEIFNLCRNNRRSLGMFSQEQKSAEEDRIKSGIKHEVEDRIKWEIKPEAEAQIKPEIKKR
mgnify:CR=1 FL=1